MPSDARALAAILNVARSRGAKHAFAVAWKDGQGTLCVRVSPLVRPRSRTHPRSLLLGNTFQSWTDGFSAQQARVTYLRLRFDPQANQLQARVLGEISKGTAFPLQDLRRLRILNRQPLARLELVEETFAQRAAASELAEAEGGRPGRAEVRKLLLGLLPPEEQQALFGQPAHEALDRLAEDCHALSQLDEAGEAAAAQVLRQLLETVPEEEEQALDQLPGPGQVLSGSFDLDPTGRVLRKARQARLKAALENIPDQLDYLGAGGRGQAFTFEDRGTKVVVKTTHRDSYEQARFLAAGVQHLRDLEGPLAQRVEALEARLASLRQAAARSKGIQAALRVLELQRALRRYAAALDPGPEDGAEDDEIAERRRRRRDSYLRAEARLSRLGDGWHLGDFRAALRGFKVKPGGSGQHPRSGEAHAALSRLDQLVTQALSARGLGKELRADFETARRLLRTEPALERRRAQLQELRHTLEAPHEHVGRIGDIVRGLQDFADLDTQERAERLEELKEEQSEAFGKGLPDPPPGPVSLATAFSVLPDYARRGALDSTLRESRGYERLAHKRYVPDFFYDADQDHLALELIDGRDGGVLQRRLHDRQPLAEEYSGLFHHLFDQLDAILDDLLAEGCFLTDLKPQNLVFTKEGEPKLIDLEGVVDLHDPANATGFRPTQAPHTPTICWPHAVTPDNLDAAKDYVLAMNLVGLLGVRSGVLDLSLAAELYLEKHLEQPAYKAFLAGGGHQPPPPFHALARELRKGNYRQPAPSTAQQPFPLFRFDPDSTSWIVAGSTTYDALSRELHDPLTGTRSLSAERLREGAAACLPEDVDDGVLQRIVGLLTGQRTAPPQPQADPQGVLSRYLQERQPAPIPVPPPPAPAAPGQAPDSVPLSLGDLPSLDFSED